MKKVSSPHRAVRSLAAFCPPGRISLKNAICVILAAVAGIVSPALRAQTAHFTGVQSTLPSASPRWYPAGVAVDRSGNVYIVDGRSETVLKETLSGMSYTESTMPFTGLGCPEGVAVDGSGNVYVADSCNQDVLKETLATDGSYSPSIVVTGVNNPYGVAVDGSGNVYVADDNYNSSVFKETLAPDGSYSQSIVATMNYPDGVAVDGSGNVYILANYYTVYMETLAPDGSYSQSTVSNNYANGVAVDGSGNVYIATDNIVLKETLAPGGGYNQSTVPASGLNRTLAVAVDGSGNVYIADVNNGLGRVLKEGLSGSFGRVSVGSSSATISMIFTIDTPGAFGMPAVVTQGATGQDFVATATGSGSGSCKATNGTSFSYNPGDMCTVDVTFTPKSPGLRYGGAVLTNNAGAVIATGEIPGIGVAPQVNFLPGTQSVLGGLQGQSGVLPDAVAVDASGTLYVSDAANKQVMKLPPTGGAITVANGLNTPAGVAVDGSGNVYITDTGNNQVLLETLSGGIYTPTTLPITLSSPRGVAVDGNGNIYIADSGNNQVLKETLSGGTYTQSIVEATGLSSPAGVAVDGSGNVYIADTGNNQVLMETLSGGIYTRSVLGSGLNAPQGVSVDGMGNVYISDTGNSRVLALASGSSTQSVVGSGLNQPAATTVDGSGNVYIADTSNNRVVKLDVSDAPSLAFAPTTSGSTSSAQTVTVANVGNAPLSIVVPAEGNNPNIAVNFTLGSTACQGVAAGGSTPGTLLAGTSCQLPISFAPTGISSFSGSLVLTDNNLNAVAPAYVSQSIMLSGTGTANTPTISWAAPASIAYGTALSATQLNATASVAGSLVYSPALGAVLGAGVQTLSVTFTPTDTTDYATATATVSLTVDAQMMPVLAFTPIPTQAEGAAPFAVTAASASSGAVTYAVLTGPATITGNMVTVTGAGTVVLSANQAPSGSYAAASAITSFTVGGVPFTLTATGSSSGSSGTSASVAAGAAASFSFTLTPAAGTTFPDAITFTATGLPTGATWTFSPAMIAAGSAATPVTLSIQTVKTQTARNERPISGNPLGRVALGFLLLPLLGMKAARRRLRQMPRLLVVLFAVGLSLGAVLGISGCAGGSVTPTATAPQTYTVQATATDTTTKVQSSIPLTLTVQ